jgi:hypothetical protein
MTVAELGQAIRDTAHILWPDEQALIGTYRPMLVEEIIQKDISTTSEGRPKQARA